MMIIHVDLDAFFASLEEARNPELRGKPLVICVFTREGKSGTVATANYKAREYGIHSGMPLLLAKQKLPDAVYMEADKEYYEEKSEKIFEFLSEFGDIEKASIDEAYIEVDKEAEDMARKIKHEIEKRFGISSSIGIGKNIILAKIASKLAKPSGIKKLESIREIKEKSVSIIPGIGKKTEEKLNRVGIKTIEDLLDSCKNKKELIIENFGEKISSFLFNICNDKGREHVEEDIGKSSIGKIITLQNNSGEIDYIRQNLNRVIELLYEKVERESRSFNRVMLMLFLDNYEVVQRSKTIRQSRKIEDLKKTAYRLLEKAFESIKGKKVRRVGVFVSLVDDKKQETLFNY